jgi:hypothetical protein
MVKRTQGRGGTRTEPPQHEAMAQWPDMSTGLQRVRGGWVGGGVGAGVAIGGGTGEGGGMGAGQTMRGTGIRMRDRRHGMRTMRGGRCADRARRACFEWGGDLA